jgi:NADPH-dependent glutamate synthase beta subunit-like oxidoreductase
VWQAVFGKDPREYSVMTKEFTRDADGNVKGLVTVAVEVGGRHGQGHHRPVAWRVTLAVCLWA